MLLKCTQLCSVNTAYRTDASDSFAFKFLDGICTTVIEVDNLCLSLCSAVEHFAKTSISRSFASWTVTSRWSLLWPSMGLGGPESGTSEQGQRTSRNIFPKKLSRQDWRNQSKITLFVFLRYLTLHNGGVALAQAHGASFIIFVLQLVPPLLTATHPNVSW